jgi:hypothetical protein
MFSTTRTLVALTVLAAATLLTGASARADVAPPDLCTAPGQPCMNAAPTYNGAGTCTASTCTRSVPGDGGMMQMSYGCNLCKAGGADAATDGGGGSKSDSGCALAPGPRGQLGGGLVALTFAAVAYAYLASTAARSGRSRRRRRHRDRRP